MELLISGPSKLSSNTKQTLPSMGTLFHPKYTYTQLAATPTKARVVVNHQDSRVSVSFFSSHGFSMGSDSEMSVDRIRMSGLGGLKDVRRMSLSNPPSVADEAARP